MSYTEIRAELEKLEKSFAQDVFKYLNATGRSEKGRSYFGVLAAGNPSLVERLEQGKTPGLEVMFRVREYMAKNPVPEAETQTEAGEEKLVSGE